MLKQNLALFILLAMVAATAVVLSLPEATEAGAITTWTGTEYYKCTRDDGKICVDKHRPYSESYEPWHHKIFHEDHETNQVKRDKHTKDTVKSCSGCCAPW